MGLIRNPQSRATVYLSKDSTNLEKDKRSSKVNTTSRNLFNEDKDLERR
jgi:hypothetical protein